MQFIFILALLCSAAALPVEIPAVEENLVEPSPVLAKSILGNSDSAFGALVDQEIPAVGKQQDTSQYGGDKTNFNENVGVESVNTYDPSKSTLDATATEVDQSIQTDVNSPSQYDGFNPIVLEAGSEVTTPVEPTVYSSNGQKSMYYRLNSDEDERETYRLVGVAPSNAVKSGSLATPYSANNVQERLVYKEIDDDDFYGFSGTTSGLHQVPLTYTALDLNQVNLQNVRSSGHAEQIVMPSFDSGELELETYRLVGVAPSNAAKLGSLATPYSANMDQQVPVYKEIDDDDFYGFSGTKSGFNQVPQHYTAVDLSQVNFQNLRSSGYAEQIVMPSIDSGELELETYRLVGVAPSNAVKLGSLATPYSANMGQEVPVYKEIDDDDFYGLSSTPNVQNLNTIPTLYSSVAGSNQPFHVKAETTLKGNNVVLLLD